MKVEHFVEVKVVLELNQEEVTWLRNVMKRPFEHEQPDDRNEYLRRKFFEALTVRT